MTRRQAVQIIKPPVTWILVADSRQAQVYTRSRVEKLMPLPGNSKRNQFSEIIAHEPVPVLGMKWEAESADQYKVGRNATGMVFESASSARSMSEPHMDAREEIKFHFAEIMKYLDLDLNDDSLRDTPKRIAKMFVNEIFSWIHRATCNHNFFGAWLSIY